MTNPISPLSPFFFDFQPLLAVACSELCYQEAREEPNVSCKIEKLSQAFNGLVGDWNRESKIQKENKSIPHPALCHLNEMLVKILLEYISLRDLASHDEGIYKPHPSISVSRAEKSGWFIIYLMVAPRLCPEFLFSPMTKWETFWKSETFHREIILFTDYVFEDQKKFSKCCSDIFYESSTHRSQLAQTLKILLDGYKSRKDFIDPSLYFFGKSDEIDRDEEADAGLYKLFYRLLKQADEIDQARGEKSFDAKKFYTQHALLYYLLEIGNYYHALQAYEKQMKALFRLPLSASEKRDIKTWQPVAFHYLTCFTYLRHCEETLKRTPIEDIHFDAFKGLLTSYEGTPKEKLQALIYSRERLYEDRLFHMATRVTKIYLSLKESQGARGPAPFFEFLRFNYPVVCIAKKMLKIFGSYTESEYFSVLIYQADALFQIASHEKEDIRKQKMYAHGIHHLLQPIKEVFVSSAGASVIAEKIARNYTILVEKMEILRRRAYAPSVIAGCQTLYQNALKEITTEQKREKLSQTFEHLTLYIEKRKYLRSEEFGSLTKLLDDLLSAYVVSPNDKSSCAWLTIAFIFNRFSSFWVDWSAFNNVPPIIEHLLDPSHMDPFKQHMEEKICAHFEKFKKEFLAICKRRPEMGSLLIKSIRALMASYPQESFLHRGFHQLLETLSQ